MVPHALMVLLTCASMEHVPLIHQDDGTVDGALHPHGVTHSCLHGACTPHGVTYLCLHGPAPLIHQGDSTVDGAPCPHGVTHPRPHGACTTRPPG